jgi:hypothetical protein
MPELTLAFSAAAILALCLAIRMLESTRGGRDVE